MKGKGMNGEKIAVTLAETRKEIGSLKHRMDEVEEMTISINNLAISVEKLALSVSTMLERQDSYENRLKVQGERLGALERADAEKWKHIVKTVIATLVTGVMCYMLAKVGL